MIGQQCHWSAEEALFAPTTHLLGAVGLLPMGKGPRGPLLAL